MCAVALSTARNESSSAVSRPLFIVRPPLSGYAEAGVLPAGRRYKPGRRISGALRALFAH
jgi:hypothetical protein